MAAPLAGLRVLEVASWLAVPSCAALMSDLGASVIKVEPPGGDAYRRLFSSLLGPEFVHPAFQCDNRGKRGIAIDMEQDEGRELVRQLATDVDVFLTNLTRPRLVRYGLTEPELHALSPSAVYTLLSGYGSTGPDAEREAFDQSAFWARSGTMSLMGDVTGIPALCRGGFGDHTTALNLLASTLAALRLRDRTGEGQTVEVTLERTGVWALAGDVCAALYTRTQPARHDNARPANPIWNHYRTRDGRWVLLTMPMAMAHWPRFCRLLGRPEWDGDERFQTLLGLAQKGYEVIPEIREIIASRELEHWAREFDAAGLIWAPVAELPEVIEDPSLRDVGAFSLVDHRKAGAVEIVSAPFSIRGAGVQVRGPAPDLGQHTREICEQLGFSASRIGALLARGVVRGE